MIRRTSPVERRQHARQVRPDREERPPPLELLATNGRVIASSEVYNTKAAAMTGIRSVQKNGAIDVVVTADELEASRRPAKKTAAKKTPAKKA